MAENPCKLNLAPLITQEGLMTRLMMKKTPVTAWSMTMSSNVKTNIVIVLSVAENPCKLNLAPLNPQEGLETVLMTKTNLRTVLCEF